MGKFKMPKGLKVADMAATAEELNDAMDLDPVIKTKKRKGAQLFEDIGGVVAELDPAKDKLSAATIDCLTKLELLPDAFKEEDEEDEAIKCPEGHKLGTQFNELEACADCDDDCFDACEDATKKTTKKTAKKKAGSKKKTGSKKKAAGKKSSEKKEKKSSNKKTVGVIASIYECIEKKGPVSQDDIVAFLEERFPERDATSMSKTVRAQIGGKKKPCRMEREKDVTFKIKDDKYSIK